MQLPVAHTDPAIFIVAFFASHVVASSILVDIDFAVGAFLGVFYDVVVGKPLFHNLPSPLLNFVAWERPMTQLFTLEAHPT